MAKDAKKQEDGPVGVVMLNGEVSAFTRKHGPALFSKPHGAEKTILYYGSKDQLDRGVRGAPLGFNRREGAIFRGRRGAAVENLGNPNEALRDAKILNKGDLDKEVQKVEKQILEETQEGRDAAATATSRVRRAKQDQPKKSAEKAIGGESLTPNADANDETKVSRPGTLVEGEGEGTASEEAQDSATAENTKES